MRRVLQEFMDTARQSLPLLRGLPAPLIQAINKNDPEELQRIFRSGAVHALLTLDVLHRHWKCDHAAHDGYSMICC